MLHAEDSHAEQPERPVQQSGVARLTPQTNYSPRRGTPTSPETSYRRLAATVCSLNPAAARSFLNRPRHFGGQITCQTREKPAVRLNRENASRSGLITARSADDLARRGLDLVQKH